MAQARRSADRGVFSILSARARDKLRAQEQPLWAAPMLATLAREPFSDPRWLYERKLDGERCLAFRDRTSVRLLSRNGKPRNDTYPELVDAIGGQRAQDFVVDGEVVAFERGVTSFSRLQRRMQVRDPDEARRSRIPSVIIFSICCISTDAIQRASSCATARRCCANRCSSRGGSGSRRIATRAGRCSSKRPATRGGRA